MQNIFLFIFLIFLSYSSLIFGVENLDLVNKLNEHKEFYKNQPRQNKRPDLSQDILPATFDDEIIDLEAEFKKAESTSSKRRLR